MMVRREGVTVYPRTESTANMAAESKGEYHQAKDTSA